MLNEEDYLKLSLTQRQEHLNLCTSCIERGGSSTQHRGILSQYLNTRIFNRPVNLCHKCNNPKCSNPLHLYWGSTKENMQDAIDNGTFKSVWENLVNKYGYEKACAMNKRSSDIAAKAGKGNKGKRKSDEHKQKISNSLKKNK